MPHSYSEGFSLIHRHDILNALLAIYSARQQLASPNDARSEIYQVGFDAALLAMAQMFGQADLFLTEKSKLKHNFSRK